MLVGLCTLCCRRRRKPTEAGAKPSLRCKKCHLAKLIKRVNYDSKLPERRRAQADAFALAELHIESLRRKLKPPHRC
jgi:DNA polymerase III epsilon subunit-like protein